MKLREIVVAVLGFICTGLLLTVLLYEINQKQDLVPSPPEKPHYKVFLGDKVLILSKVDKTGYLRDRRYYEYDFRDYE